VPLASRHVSAFLEHDRQLSVCHHVVHDEYGLLTTRTRRTSAGGVSASRSFEQEKHIIIERAMTKVTYHYYPAG
jgi:hypothetical protein